MTNWPITETYTEPYGQFIGYDSSNAVVGTTSTVSGVGNALLQNQQHIDVRGFVPSGIISLPQYSMLNLDSQEMTALDSLNMGQLEVAQTLGDQWSAGTLGPISALQNVVGLTWVLTSGTHTTTSTLPAVNLTQGFQPNDYLCLSLPSFPLASINTSQSYVTLYDGVNTQTLYLSNSFAALTAGNTCAAWHYSSLTVLEPITVSVTLAATAGCTVEITGLRLLSQTWQPLQLDMNTQGQFLRGITTQSGVINLATNTQMPMAWRCAVPQGVNDPQPINSNFSVLLYTGSLQNNSTINMYFRGRNETGVTQQTLDFVQATGAGFVQSGLDGLGTQPDFSLSHYPTTSGVDLSPYYWIQTGITYQSGSNATVAINSYSSTATDTYSYTTSVRFLPQQYYLFTVSLQDTSLGHSISSVSSYGGVQTPALYTGPTINNSDFRRTAGRIGWSASLGDGDGFVKSFVGQSLMFAEYRSKPFQSRTPVRGASLVVSATPPAQLYTNIVPYEGASVTTNMAISSSTNGSTQIYGTAGQGAQTNIFSVTNFANFSLQFSLYVPAATLNQTTPGFALLNSVNYFFPFVVGQILPNSWQNYNILPGAFSNLLPGNYSLVTFSVFNAPTVWYIDNLNISQTPLIWSARSAPQDPWNANPISWVSFGNLINDTSDGVTFTPAGNALEVRAQAFAQNVIIDKYLIQPQYSTLGNLLL